MLTSDRVWYQDVRAITRRPAEFFPSRFQTPEERVNSIVRLLLYVTVGVYLYRRQAKYLVFGLAAIAAVSVAYKGGSGDPTVRRRASVAGVRVDSVLPAQRACTLSTPNNPYANMLLTDDPARPPACKYDDQQDLIRDNFNRGLVRNMYDIYEKENSQRQWMINPVTTSTPDTVAFAQFCYGNAGRRTCKEDPTKCTGAFP